MNFTDREKQLLMENAPVYSRIRLYNEDGSVLQIFNEDDYLINWEYEDFRYVPDQGFIGQFVERLLDGKLSNIPENISLEDKEIDVEIAVKDPQLQEQVYHNYGRFIITKIEKEDTTGSYKFESSDYTKKFNEVYTGGVTFPCTALKLLNSACDQVGVELDTSNNAQAIDYIVSVDGLQAGNYAFLINGTYYNFTLNEGLTSGNLLMLKGDKLILRKVTSDYEIIREEIPYGTSETSSNTILSDEPYDYYELINDDFIVNDNQFTENNTCRDVVRSVAQLSYTWARINENNKLCLDFVKNDNVDSYDEIDTDKYYEATVTGDKVEPINKVLIGMSQVEGENIVMERDGDLLDVDRIYGETSQNGTPTPSSPQNINTVRGNNVLIIGNKNIFDGIYQQGGLDLGGNGGETSSNIRIRSDYIPVKPSTTYIISNNNENLTHCGIGLYKSNKSYDSSHKINAGGWNEFPISFTTESDTSYVRMSFRNGDGNEISPTGNYEIQLEQGSAATPYTPFEEQTYNIDLPVENLFDINNTPIAQNTLSDAGITLTFNNDGTITANGTNTGTYKFIRYNITLPAGTYYYSGCVSGGTTNGYSMQTLYPNTADYGNGGTFTLTQTTTIGFLPIRIGSDTITFNNAVFKPMITKIKAGYEAYTPYGTTPIELCKIGDYQDYITRNTGKNLFNKDDYIEITGTPNEHNFVGGDSPNRNIVIQCKPSTTYTVQKRNDGDTNRFALCTSVTPPTIDTTTPVSNFIRSNDVRNLTITSGENDNYLIIHYYRTVETTLTKQQVLDSIQIEEGNTATTYEPYGNGEWYLKKEIGKWVLDNSYNWTSSGAGVNPDAIAFRLGDNPQISEFNNNKVGYSDMFHIQNGTEWNSDRRIGTATLTGKQMYVRMPKATIPTLNDFKTWVTNHPITVIAPLDTPEYQKITYTPLIEQLNALQETPLFEGANYVTIDTLNEIPSLDITVTDLEQDSTSYSGKSFEITGHDYDKGGSIYIYDNPLTYTEELRRIAINGAENLFGLTYTPMEVQSIGHPWLTGKEFVKITNLENQELYFYPFDRKISYTGVLTTDLSAQAKNEVAQKYENRNNVVDKINHTEISVNKANGTIEALSRTVDGNKEEFTQWQSTEYNSLKSTVGEIDRDLNVGNDSIHSRLSSVEQTTTAITNMFQITGGINVIRNSAFLLQDNVWEFTDSGTNPYHTPLGASYNSALSGQTVSVAEIKARSTKIKSKSENITNLILNTKYTFNFYHKQDNNMTTTIKMYSTENNSSKAFDDIVITGQQDFKNYDVSFTPTSYTNYTLEIIITSTSSIGYAYIYDMMLNSGDKQAWQPASDEIYSTTLQMSRLGLKVYSVGDGTITLLGSDGMSTYETSDGKTLGRLVSMRTEAGDRVKTVTSEALYLTKDIREENANRWVETIVTISGTPYKVEYIESGGQ